MMDLLDKGWELLDIEFYDNELRLWLVALVIALVALIVLRLVRWTFIRRAKDEEGDFGLDDLALDLLRETKFFFALAIALYLGSLVLTLPSRLVQVIEVLVVIIFLVQLAFWGNELIAYALTRYRLQRLEEGGIGSTTTVATLNVLSRILLWSIIILLILDNLGIEVTALIAGLGIGAVAVGLAVQNILGDLFASLSIIFDKPFVVGDVIKMDDFIGTVERVGLKTTRVRSLAGEQLVFSNSDLVQGRIQNYKRMEQRRILFSIGVTYQTPYEILVAIPGMIREIIEAQDMARFDRAHFFQYGDSALNFEIVYYVLSPDYNVYMDVQQAINLGIFSRFTAEGIDFAYPTRVLEIKQPLPVIQADGSS